MTGGRRSRAAASPSPRRFSGRRDHVVSGAAARREVGSGARGSEPGRGLPPYLLPVWGTGSSDAKCTTASGFPRITHRPGQVSPSQPLGHLPQLLARSCGENVSPT